MRCFVAFSYIDTHTYHRSVAKDLDDGD